MSDGEGRRGDKHSPTTSTTAAAAASCCTPTLHSSRSAQLTSTAHRRPLAHIPQLYPPTAMFAPPLIATDVAAADTVSSTQPAIDFFPSSAASHTSHSSDVPASPALLSSDPRLSRRGPNLSATRRPSRRADVPPSPLLPLTSPHLSSSSLHTPLIPQLSSASFALPSHLSTLTSAFSSIAHTPATTTATTSSTLPPLPPFSLSSTVTSTTQPPPLPPVATGTHLPQTTTSDSSDAAAALLDNDDTPLGLLSTARKRRKTAQPATHAGKRTPRSQQAQTTRQTASGG